MSVCLKTSKLVLVTYVCVGYLCQSLRRMRHVCVGTCVWTLRGSFVKSKEKHLKQGEKISNLENALQILFIYLWPFAKELWKRFTKEFAKTKHVVQAWSKMLNKKETIHTYLVSSYIGSIPSNLCTYIMQTSSIMHFYTCFGLCWHQSPKRGRLKGN